MHRARAYHRTSVEAHHTPQHSGILPRIETWDCDDRIAERTVDHHHDHNPVCHSILLRSRCLLITAKYRVLRKLDRDRVAACDVMKKAQ
jgi:hypothetical protein